MNWIQEAIKGIQPILYNTETREKEAPKLQKKGQLTLYTCGPTVYSFAHIGNFRTYVFEDLLRRTLEVLGLKVCHVMNITDVDDKTIKGAIQDGVSLDVYTKPYKAAFFDDLKTLRIRPAHNYPAATSYVRQMVAAIETLMSKGLAYAGHDGSVYYSIGKFPRYGCLSHLKLDELQTGASDRVASDEYDKENASDFVLWKAHDAARDGEIFWESPWGPGRPGWHLECSVMAMELLGETVDIHVGGVDNIFPHHENEIAQSEGCTGKRFVGLWMHSEHLIVDGKKMSKSLGNFYTLRDLLEKGYSGEQVRYMLLHTHYRSQLNFTFNELDGVKASIERLQAFVRRLHQAEVNGKGGELKEKLPNVARAFFGALADDLNISHALGVLFDWVREANALMDEGRLSPEEARMSRELLQAVNQILDVLHFEEETVPEALQRLLQERETARQEKNWARADELRDKILLQGFRIEDTSKGPQLVRNS